MHPFKNWVAWVAANIITSCSEIGHGSKLFRVSQIENEVFLSKWACWMSHWSICVAFAKNIYFFSSLLAPPEPRSWIHCLTSLLILVLVSLIYLFYTFPFPFKQGAIINPNPWMLQGNLHTSRSSSQFQAVSAQSRSSCPRDTAHAYSEC